MNKQRRAEITKAVNMIEEGKAILESVRDEEQDTFDNMPESLQGGEKGSAMEEAVNNLDEAINSLDETVGTVNTVVEG
jgi:ribosome recycling factor